jgi:hypothetical protein
MNEPMSFPPDSMKMVGFVIKAMIAMLFLLLAALGMFFKAVSKITRVHTSTYKVWIIGVVFGTRHAIIRSGLAANDASSSTSAHFFMEFMVFRFILCSRFIIIGILEVTRLMSSC